VIDPLSKLEIELPSLSRVGNASFDLKTSRSLFINKMGENFNVKESMFNHDIVGVFSWM